MENNKKKLPKILKPLKSNENYILREELIKKIQTDINDFNDSDKSSDKSFSSISCSSIDLESENENRPLLQPIAKRPIIPIINTIFRQDNKIHTDESFVLPKYIGKLQNKKNQSNLFTSFK